MKNALLTILLLMLVCSGNSQDRIYSFYYPHGLVTNNLTEQRRYYELTPVDNSDLKIKISKESTRKIIYQSGTVFVNASPVDYENRIVLSSDSLSGKIYYTGLFEVNGVKKKSLFDIVKTIPQGIIKYELQASDEVNFSFQKYMCYFPLKFAGDPYILTCNLLIKFKDGKVKYEYSDFTATYEQSRTRKAYDWSNSLKTEKKVRTVILDKMYAVLGRSDIKTFWEPIPIRINESISTIKRLCATQSQDNENW